MAAEVLCTLLCVLDHVRCVVRATPVGEAPPLTFRRHARARGPYTGLYTTEQARRRLGRPRRPAAAAATARQSCPAPRARLPWMIATVASPGVVWGGEAAPAVREKAVSRERGRGGGGSGALSPCWCLCVCVSALASAVPYTRRGFCALLWWTQGAASHIELVRGHLPPFCPNPIHPPPHSPPLCFLSLHVRAQGTRPQALLTHFFDAAPP